jgi:hypothetical protein
MKNKQIEEKRGWILDMEDRSKATASFKAVSH